MHSNTSLASLSPHTQPAISSTHSAANNTLMGSLISSYDRPQGLSYYAHSNGPNPTTSGTLAQQPQFIASPPSLPRVDYLPYACELPTNDPVSTYIGSNVSSLGGTTPSPRTGEMDSPSLSHVQSIAIDPWAQIYPSDVPPVPPQWSDYQAVITPSPAIGAYGEGSSHSREQQFCLPEAYLPCTELLYPVRQDPNTDTEYMSTSLTSAGSSPTHTAISVGSYGSDAMNVHAEATLASQPLGLNNGPVADTDLPQFFPSSSSSLSAMINPRIHIYSSNSSRHDGSSV